MKFELYNRNPGSPHELWDWTLVSKDGYVCRSPIRFGSETSARSHIARAKTAMKGARFAKVEVMES